MVSLENRKLIMEALGVFALCYVGGWSVEWALVNKASTTAVAIAHGLVLGLFVFLGGSISGGHYNPAVSIALCVTGYQRLEETMKYVLAQFGGSMLAGIILFMMKPDWLTSRKEGLLLGHPSLPDDVDTLTGFVCEAVATGFLVLCVFAAGIHRKAHDGVVATLVGSSLMLGVLSIGNVTGAALNPCRVFGPAMFSGRVGDRGHMIYYLGPIFGGVATGVTYKVLFIVGGKKIGEFARKDDKRELDYTTDESLST